MSNPIDPDRFALSAPVNLKHVTSARSLYSKRGEEFLSGPIPLWWLKEAAMLRGKALAVGLALWFKTRATKQDAVKGSHSLWNKLGVNQKSAYCALRALEGAALISIERHSGRCPIVTIQSVLMTKPDFGTTAQKPSTKPTMEE